MPDECATKPASVSQTPHERFSAEILARRLLVVRFGYFEPREDIIGEVVIVQHKIALPIADRSRFDRDVMGPNAIQYGCEISALAYQPECSATLLG